MVHYTYLVIGGGIAADSAVHAIREIDQDSSIGLISKENHSPYDRPPLSKGLWMKGDHAVDIEDIWRDTGNLGVNMHLDRTASTLHPDRKKIIDHQGTIYTYDKLLISTGGTPIRLRDDGSAGNVLYYRTVDDYTALRALVDEKQRFGVIGGGFIGSEIAAALAMNGKDVTMIFPESGICSTILPITLSKRLNGYYGEHGVRVIPGETVASIKDTGEAVEAFLANGKKERFDAIVAGLGIAPETTLAETAGLKVRNGIVVDEHLQTSMAGIYAAGDVASLVHPDLKTLMRFEHEDNADAMGEVAGCNMAGKETTYSKLPMFYSDMFDHGYEAVGDVNAKLDIVIDWKKEFEEGVFYYTKNSRVRGVLLWNVWEQVDKARELIKTKGIFNSQNLRGKIPFD